jgi:predicted dehydrogenase
VGAGYWGKNYVRLFDDIVQADLKCVCDMSNGLLDSVLQKWPYVKTTKRLEEMLAMDEITSIVVSTPAATHYRIVKATLEAGKNTLCLIGVVQFVIF